MAHRTNFVANVNIDDNDRLKMKVNPFSNDNVWNAKYRHRFVTPKLVVSPRHGSGCFLLFFLLKSFLPTAEHSVYFLQMFRKGRIFFVWNALVLPSYLQEKFYAIELGDCGHKASYFSFRRKIN